jgi:DNA-binding transcriptional LysR family regulator
VDFYRLQIFRTVAKHLSYSKAADELFISQPAVSKHVHLLEQELGEKLLMRSGRALQLTDAGRLAFDCAQRLEALAEELELALRELRDLERGTLRLAASETPGHYLLPESLSRFHHRHPGVRLTLDVSNSSTVVERVLRREVDLGFVGKSKLPAGLQVLPLVEDEIVLIASPAHPFGTRGKVSLQAIASAPIVMREPGSGTRAEVEDALARHGLAPSLFLELRGTEAVRQAVLANLGVAFLSRQAVAREVATGELRVVQIEGFALWRRISALSLKTARLSPAALAFVAEQRKSLGRWMQKRHSP